MTAATTEEVVGAGAGVDDVVRGGAGAGVDVVAGEGASAALESALKVVAGGVNWEVEDSSSVEEVVGARRIDVSDEEAMLEDRDTENVALEILMEGDVETGEDDDEIAEDEIGSVVDTAAELRLEEGELPIAPAIVADAAGALAVLCIASEMFKYVFKLDLRRNRHSTRRSDHRIPVILFRLLDNSTPRTGAHHKTRISPLAFTLFNTRLLLPIFFGTGRPSRPIRYSTQEINNERKQHSDAGHVNCLYSNNNK